ncbi:hypothetical protein EDD86DRAFT_208260 [Gorgonomyces haynaldii]|nr:hypothetical protein EDD86DRAFT_208260 [Gorgonomyces haynaldii]
MDKLLRLKDQDLATFVQQYPQLLMQPKSSVLDALYERIKRLGVPLQTPLKVHFKKLYKAEIEIDKSDVQHIVEYGLRHIRKLNKRFQKQGQQLLEDDLLFLLEWLETLDALERREMLSVELAEGFVGVYQMLHSEKQALVQDIYQDKDLDDDERLGRKIKRQCVQLFYKLFALNYLEPTEEQISEMCDLMSYLFESQATDGPTLLLHSNPLVLDLELLCGLTSLFVGLKDNPRVQYLLNTMDHLLVFSGNKETKAQMDQEPQMDDLLMVSMISQIHELFPDLGEGYIEALLLALGKNPDTVIMKILENDLPKEVEKLDKSMPRTFHGSLDTLAESVQTLQLNDPLEKRRNVFDGDEFDVFAQKELPQDRIILGKQENTLEEDEAFKLAQKERMKRYDAYEDEYDDTYDSQDIVLGGQFETAEKEVVQDPLERTLVDIYNTDPGQFHKSMRNTPQRQQFLKKTQMTHEQFEGWYVMLMRNPRKEEILSKYEWRGNHKEAEDRKLMELKEKKEKPSEKDHNGKPSEQKRPPGRGRKANRARGHLRKMQRGMTQPE